MLDLKWTNSEQEIWKSSAQTICIGTAIDTSNNFASSPANQIDMYGTVEENNWNPEHFSSFKESIMDISPQGYSGINSGHKALHMEAYPTTM